MLASPTETWKSAVVIFVKLILQKTYAGNEWRRYCVFIFFFFLPSFLPHTSVVAARLAHFRVPLAFRQYIRYCHFLLLICFHRKLTLTFHCPALHHRRPTRSVTWLVSFRHETYQEIVYGNLDRTGQANHKTLKMNKKKTKNGGHLCCFVCSTIPNDTFSCPHISHPIWSWCYASCYLRY